MNYSSGFLIFFLLVCHFFPYSSSSMRIIMIQQLTKATIEDHHHMSRGSERDHVQRKALHEVHSGPNPISNCIPQQKLKFDTQRKH
ncbi:hypothetical protein AAZX31_15G226700 [Glycine max]|uniref:Secreted protein n=1 Tax=Glycine soja TaxID=3848 RepID=A0A0B2SSJ3_GLYSO|nr:hypothetical protein JHK87_043438 [Glycine soja]KAG4950289.1 hypothetical protein JHK86_043528 [Glycine max]KAG4957808.1 hypothetical protein JHK85_044188 [Glycine max]KAG5106672.1 hypothetical protein JHK82_043642 [Glycine max]KAG5117597.1 hypothetical protein JHK84_043710 [Glycine max]